MDSNSSFNNFSIVIPIYNEEEILAESINNILSICERTSIEYEIIISENGSTDNTKNLARDFEQNNSKIVLIESDHPNYGEALKRGFLKCKNEIIISFDIDYYSESFLKECLLLEDKYAGLIASKRLSNSEDGRRLIRKLATNFFVYILKILFSDLKLERLSEAIYEISFSGFKYNSVIDVGFKSLSSTPNIRLSISSE